MITANESSTCSDDVAAAIELANEIQERVLDLPERADEFAASVSDKTAEIAFDIEERNRVTPRQMQALENMRDGVNRWLEH